MSCLPKLFCFFLIRWEEVLDEHMASIEMEKRNGGGGSASPSSGCKSAAALTAMNSLDWDSGFSDG